jgi:hypothetical protein
LLLLDLLKHGALSFDTLVGEFRALTDDLDPDELADLVTSVIESIRKIGLIETSETLP